MKMDAWKRQAFRLVDGLVMRDEKDPSVVRRYPRKTEISPRTKTKNKHVHYILSGMRASALRAMLDELSEQSRANVHNLLIVKNGKTVLDVSAPGYGTDTWHLAHSMSKTVTGIAIGLLFDEGKITPETLLCDLFSEYLPKDKGYYSMTVGHLLAMRSGVPFAETGSVTAEDWTDSFFGCTLDFMPGTDYRYNSMNSYILSRIVRRVSGESLADYLRRRLFEPLGITDFFWEKSPEGDEMGGWGLYLDAHAWAKIGQMMMDGGVYDGRRVLSEEWIRRATAVHSQTDPEAGDFDYGYHLWRSRDSEDFLFNGMLGQNVLICPERGVVAVLQSGNNELFSQSPALSIVRRYLRDENTYGRDSLRASRALAAAVDGFFVGRCFVRVDKLSAFSRRFGLGEKTSPFADLCGTYCLRPNNAGILPAFLRVMQNNYAGGMEKIAFLIERGRLYFVSTEGGRDYRLRIGTSDFEENTLLIEGEKYLVRAIAERRGEEYRFLFVLPEMPNERRITVIKEADGSLLIALDETPDEHIAAKWLDPAKITGIGGIVLNYLDRKVDDNFLEKKMRELFHPTFRAVSESAPDCGEILKAEADARTEDLNAIGPLARGVISRFIKRRK